MPFLHCGIMQEESDFEAKVHGPASRSSHVKTFRQCEMAGLVAKPVYVISCYFSYFFLNCLSFFLRL